MSQRITGSAIRLSFLYVGVVSLAPDLNFYNHPFTYPTMEYPASAVPYSREWLPRPHQRTTKRVLSRRAALR
jgi:hypothetical protein